MVVAAAESLELHIAQVMSSMMRTFPRSSPGSTSKRRASDAKVPHLLLALLLLALAQLLTRQRPGSVAEMHRLLLLLLLALAQLPTRQRPGSGAEMRHPLLVRLLLALANCEWMRMTLLARLLMKIP